MRSELTLNSAFTGDGAGVYGKVVFVNHAVNPCCIPTLIVSASPVDNPPEPDELCIVKIPPVLVPAAGGEKL